MNKIMKKSIEELLEESLVPEEEQPYKLPDNWVWTILDNVGTLKGRIGWKGYTKGDLRDSGPLVLGAAQINKSDELDLSKPVFISDEKYEESPEIQVSPNDILIVKTGASIGKIALVKPGIGRACINPNVALLKDIWLNPLFISYFMKSSEFKNELWSNVNSSAQPAINQKAIKSIKIPIPPQNEQKRIAKKVERLLNKIDEAKKLIDEVKETFEIRRAAILDKAFRGELLNYNFTKKDVNINNQVSLEIPEHWEVKPLKEIVTNFNNKRIPVSQKKREEMQGNIPYYGATGIVDFVDGFTHEGEYVLVGEDGANLLSRAKPQAFIVKGKSWVNNHAHVISMKETGSNSFLMHYLNYLPLNDYVTGTAQPKLNRKNLDNILMVVPPINEQKEISNKINRLLSLEKEVLLTFDIDQLNTMKQSILSKAFRGELGTNDPTEESAIELLKAVCDRA